MVAALVARTVAAVPAGYWPSSVTIREKTGETRGSTGEAIPTYGDLSGHVGIVATKAPMDARELQLAGYTVTDRIWKVELQGAYPTITTAHQAVIDGDEFDIDSAITDQTASVTQLRVRLVST